MDFAGSGYDGDTRIPRRLQAKSWTDVNKNEEWGRGS